MIDRQARIWVTGHRGLVGSAIVRRLAAAGFNNIATATRAETDLRDPQAVVAWVRRNQPRYVIHAAGKVGGILANSQYPADFLHDNLLIQAAVLRAAWEHRVEKLLYLGSSCIYPRDCPQPIREEYLLTGPLEESNFGYAIAKISGVLGCRAYRRQYGCRFISAMPTNLYGPHDNFDLQSSHVVPALIRKFHDAKLRRDVAVTVWGSGTPRREFLHVDDLADACLFLMDHYDEEQTINIGTGEDVTIHELAELISAVVQPGARLDWDVSKPEGTPRKLLDVGRLHALGWRHRIDLPAGIRQTYAWYLAALASSHGSASSTLDTTESR